MRLWRRIVPNLYQRTITSNVAVMTAARIQLIPEEEKLVSSLDAFAKELFNQKQQKVELRIAGGWVRDKVSSLLS